MFKIQQGSICIYHSNYTVRTPSKIFEVPLLFALSFIILSNGHPHCSLGLYSKNKAIQKIVVRLLILVCSFMNNIALNLLLYIFIA